MKRCGITNETVRNPRPGVVPHTKRCGITREWMRDHRQAVMTAQAIGYGGFAARDAAGQAHHSQPVYVVCVCVCVCVHARARLDEWLGTPSMSVSTLSLWYVVCVCTRARASRSVLSRAAC